VSFRNGSVQTLTTTSRAENLPRPRDPSRRTRSRTGSEMKKIKKGTPKLSVVIVNYNADDLLADCVQAVLASPVDPEVVISDNGSTDGSLTHVRSCHGEDPRLTILEHGSNLGFARGNNLALAHTHAPCVLILNPDCIVGPDSLGRLLDFMDATPDARNGRLYDS